MRIIFQYIRSLFCKHEWEYLGKTRLFYEGRDMPYRIIDRWRCTKCGFIMKDHD